VTKPKTFVLFLLIGISLLLMSCEDSGNTMSSKVNQPVDAESNKDNEPVIVEDNTESQPKPQEDSQDSASLDAEEIQREDFPIPVVEDAYEFEDFFGRYTYLTDLPIDQVIDFYRTEMQSLGYEMSAEAMVANGTIFNFKKQGSIVTMNVLNNDDGSVTVRYVEGNP
jgi:hypothetical protein